MPKQHEKKQEQTRLTDDDVLAKYAPKITEFLSGEWSHTGVLTLEAMNSFERRVVHAYAEGLGLDHKSKDGHFQAGYKEVVVRRADWSVSLPEGGEVPLEAQLEADLERVASVLSNNEEPFIVFEGSAAEGTTTPDSHGLLYGLEPRGSGDWDLTITAMPKQRAGGNQQYTPVYIECEDLESLLVDLLCVDYVYVCPNGGCPTDWRREGGSSVEYPCACWQGQKVNPQKVCWSCEWDGNSGDVSFETDQYCFEIVYSTS